MVRSGLQQDVINRYRQGVRNAFSKPHEARPSFLLHLRYNFRNPKLAKRDYTAIEHQLRKMSHTLEMLSSDSVKRIGVSGDMIDWWDKQIADRQMSAAVEDSILAQHLSLADKEDGKQSETPAVKDQGEGKVKESSDGKEAESEQPIGDGKMPGPGGT